jgi:putative heme iron utilization protein
MVVAPDDRLIPKLLLRTTRTAALATIDRGGGAPLATLVSMGTDFSGAPLLLLSQLAHHTKNLAVDARGSLLLSSRAERGDPLNRPRLTMSGPIVAHQDPKARARFVRQNPKSRLYASFADFGVYRMEVQSVHFNGGFGRAFAVAPEELLTNVEGAEGLIEAEESLLGWVNSADGEAASPLTMAHRPRQAATNARRWRARSLDPEGLDIASGAAAARVAFAAPALSSADWIRAFESSGEPLRL